MIKPNNDGKRIDDVISRVPCNRHNRSTGDACWSIHPNSPGVPRTRAACGPRITAAGFVGKISETATQSKRKLMEVIKKEVRS